MARMRIPPLRRVKVNNDLQRLLLAQFDGIAAKSNRWFVGTRQSHYYAYRRFLLFIGDKFRIADIRLVEPSHVAAFVRWELDNGKKPSSVLPVLSGIRFWHHHVIGRKFDIPENEVIMENELNEKTQRRYKRF